MSTKTSLAGKSDYEGPKTFTQIVRQISVDSKGRVPASFVREVVGTFFSSVGLYGYTKYGKIIKIKGLGTFKPTAEGERHFRKIRTESAIRRRDIRYKAVEKYKRKHRVLNAFKKRNEIMVSKNLKPYKFNEWLRISGRKMPK